MPIIPSFVERLILLKLNQGPGVMLALREHADERQVAAGQFSNESGERDSLLRKHGI